MAWRSCTDLGLQDWAAYGPEVARIGGIWLYGLQEWGAYARGGCRIVGEGALTRPTLTPYGKRRSGTESPMNGPDGQQCSRIWRGARIENRGSQRGWLLVRRWLVVRR